MKKLKLILLYNWFFIILFIFLFLYVTINTKVIKYSSVYDLSQTKLEGVVTSFSINGNLLKIDLKAKEKVKVNYYLKNEEEKNYLLDFLSIGDKLSLEGKFVEPLNNTIPNTFNYKKYLYHKQIYFTFTASNYKVLAKNKNLFYSLKNNLLKQIYKREASDYLLVFILGDKALLNSREYTNFQINGTAHLLAISGMHIGLIISFLNLIFKKVKENKRFLIIFLILAIFAFLTGFSASVNRVVLFYILNFFNKKKVKPLMNWQVLFLTGGLLLLINPFYIYDYGFLYSLIITFGIIYYQEKIKGTYFGKLFKLSLISFLFSLPITINLNYEINLLAIFTNLVFVPLVSLIIYPLALFSLGIPNSFWPKVIKGFIFLNNLGGKYNLLINIPKLSFIFIMIYYFILLISKYKPKLIFTIIIILLSAKILVKLNPNYGVYFLDVGQGDSAILISPWQEEVIMIDTGGKITYNKNNWQISSKEYPISDNTIKFLKSLGITKIDYLVLSHGDADHAGEALNIMQKLKVKNILFNEGEYNTLESKIRSRNVNIVKKIISNYFPNQILEHELKSNENDNSLINLIKVGLYKFLFLGDISKSGEEEILTKYKFQFDFVKLAHHGSKTSTTDALLKKDFLFAIISSGRNNRYNHPSEETLIKLDNFHKNYYNTQDVGTIFIKINTKAYTIQTYKP